MKQRIMDLDIIKSTVEKATFTCTDNLWPLSRLANIQIEVVRKEEERRTFVSAEATMQGEIFRTGFYINDGSDEDARALFNYAKDLGFIIKQVVIDVAVKRLFELDKE